MLSTSSLICYFVYCSSFALDIVLLINAEIAVFNLANKSKVNAFLASVSWTNTHLSFLRWLLKTPCTGRYSFKNASIFKLCYFPFPKRIMHLGKMMASHMGSPSLISLPVVEMKVVELNFFNSWSHFSTVARYCQLSLFLNLSRLMHCYAILLSSSAVFYLFGSGSSFG